MPLTADETPAVASFYCPWYDMSFILTNKEKSGLIPAFSFYDFKHLHQPTDQRFNTARSADSTCDASKIIPGRALHNRTHYQAGLHEA